MDFATTKTLVLNYIRRPSTEVSTEVGDAINRICKFAAANHDFAVLEYALEGTYTAGAVTIPFSTIFTGVDVRMIRSLQLLTSTGDDYGDPLKIVTYTELQKFRQRQRDSGGGTVTSLNNSSYVAFIQGDTDELPNLGLYPVPASAEYVKAELAIWPVTLTGDTDTNFLLTYFPQYVLFATCFDLLYFLKIDERSMFTAEAVKGLWEQVVAWDIKLRNTTGGRL